MFDEFKWDDLMGEFDVVFEFVDGFVFVGYFFGVKKFVVGECVFQIGMYIVLVKMIM